MPIGSIGVCRYCLSNTLSDLTVEQSANHKKRSPGLREACETPAKYETFIIRKAHSAHRLNYQSPLSN